MYRAHGYDFVSLTDHFLEKYDYPIVDTRGFRQDGFTTILGAELHAPVTSRGKEWHILANGLPLDFEPGAASETGPELARRAAAAGAFVSIAHPHWSQLTLADAQTIDAAHAVEVYNHTSAVNCDRGDGLFMYDMLLSDGRKLGGVATDDSHWKVADGFGAWVMVRAPQNDPDALLRALHSGAYYATQGPQFHEIRRDGDVLQVTASAVESIMLVGAGSGSAAAFGRSLTRATLPLEKFDGTWCRAVAIDAAGRRAWSNPLWL